jgi:hypothetical protein
MAVLLAALAVLTAGCGGDGGQEQGEPVVGGLAFSARFEPDPLVAGKPVTWSLTVRNDSGEAVTLTFPSGKQGDVVLEDDRNAEVYRWSGGRFFTEAVIRKQLRPDQEVVYRLEEPSLSVEPGDYHLVATLAAEPDTGPDRQRVHIS